MHHSGRHRSFLRALIGALLLGGVTSLAAQPPAPSSSQPAPSSPSTQAPPVAAPAPGGSSATGDAAAAPQEPLPTAAEILARHVAALGGEEAILRQRHATWKGTFSMPGMGLEGTLVLRSSAPNLFHLVIEAPGLGTIAQGYDGKVGWSDNPMTGPTLMKDGELEMTAIQSDFHTDLHYTTHYPKMEVVGRETFAGEPCYKLALTTASGIATFHYFGVESGLLVGVAGDLPTPMGEVWVETVIGGYQEFGGRLFPTQNRQTAMGSEQVLTLSEADFAEIDPSVYALPEAIRTLVGGQQAQ
jgi:hypothetical protein